MNETREILTNLERRFQTFSQQQLSFVTALDRCRKTAFEPTKQISTIAQVHNYADEVSDNATDKRIFNIFLTLVRDLGEFRRALCRLSKRKSDKKLNKIFSTWKRILESRQDISKLRARFPYCHVNHLSCDEARNHFGGIVSVLPVAMECARDAVERIEIIRAYREIVNSRKESEDMSHASPNGYNRQKSSSLVPPSTFAHTSNGTCSNMQQEDVSPAISSPVINTPSQVSLHSQKSEVSFSKQGSATKSRPRPASASYAKQVLARADKACNNKANRHSAKNETTTQTPKYLTATLKPALNWPHKTISESEMRKMLKQKKHCLGRPEWKP